MLKKESAYSHDSCPPRTLLPSGFGSPSYVCGNAVPQQPHSAGGPHGGLPLNPTRPLDLPELPERDATPAAGSKEGWRPLLSLPEGPGCSAGEITEGEPGHERDLLRAASLVAHPDDCSRRGPGHFSFCCCVTSHPSLLLTLKTRLHSARGLCSAWDLTATEHLRHPSAFV